MLDRRDINQESVPHFGVCLRAEVQKKLHLDQDYPCEVVGSWNTWYGEQDQAGELHHARYINHMEFTYSGVAAVWPLACSTVGGAATQLLGSDSLATPPYT